MHVRRTYIRPAGKRVKEGRSKSKLRAQPRGSIVSRQNKGTDRVLFHGVIRAVGTLFRGRHCLPAGKEQETAIVARLRGSPWLAASIRSRSWKLSQAVGPGPRNENERARSNCRRISTERVAVYCFSPTLDTSDVGSRRSSSEIFRQNSLQRSR